MRQISYRRKPNLYPSKTSSDEIADLLRTDGWAFVRGNGLDEHVRCALAAEGAQLLDGAPTEIEPATERVKAFPFRDPSINALVLDPGLLALVRSVLGVDIRLYQAQLWAKRAGYSKYEQLYHRDYSNHMPVVPTADPRFDALKIFLLLSDVSLISGPTAFPQRALRPDLPLGQQYFTRGENTELYDSEVCCPGAPGDAVVYRLDALHRATEVRSGDRLVLELGFRTAGAQWIAYRSGLHIDYSRSWRAFVEGATVEQLVLVGFPEPGHIYWTSETVRGVAERYPGVDWDQFC